MAPQRRAAWDLYLALTMNPRVDAALLHRLSRQSHLLSGIGELLVTLIGRAQRMQLAGDQAGAEVLLRIAARWLFRLSRGESRAPGQPGP